MTMDEFPAAFDALPDPVVTVDADGVVRGGNARVESAFGHARDDLVGMAVGELFFDPDEGDAGDELGRYVADPEHRSVSVGLDLCVRRADGSALPVTLGFAPFERDGETRLLVTVVGDGDERTAGSGLHRRTQTLEALHEATQDLLKTTDREVAAEAAVEYVEEVLGHPIAAIWLYDADRDLLEPVSWTARADEVVGEHPTYTAEGRSISWAVFESGQPEYVSDTRADPDQYNPDSPIRSELVLPLGRYGVIDVGSTEPEAFGEADLAVARLWAATVTMVFVRIERERQLRSREAEIARERDRLEEFASLVSHDLRNPLNVAAGNLDLLRERLESEQEDVSELDVIGRSLDRMQELVEDMLALARQGTEIDDTEAASLSELAEECWDGVDTASASLVVRGDVRVMADRSRLRQALENLFANAVVHGRDDVAVAVGPLDDGEGFYVEDDGPGIDPDRREEAFEPGVTTDPDGTGFGLSIVAEVAEAHGWTVEIAESESGGARFEFRGVGVESGDASGE
ncbi:multi-sensor signal transduction histidine kinase [Halorubrum tebenquichense DSM 14210]|uniref:histidine kinase n=2 Tax=Halorubrum tebenquichense TaxID=119434 RepID=M0DE96_9EURY|nr:multi-sensor signal transduction histidine kinase [Halorubrum tebenquichense DSM 14210]